MPDTLDYFDWLETLPPDKIDFLAVNHPKESLWQDHQRLSAEVKGLYAEWRDGVGTAHPQIQENLGRLMQICNHQIVSLERELFKGK